MDIILTAIPFLLLHIICYSLSFCLVRLSVSQKIGSFLTRYNNILKVLQLLLLLYAVGFYYFYMIQSIWIIVIAMTVGLVTLPNIIPFLLLHLWTKDVLTTNWKWIFHLSSPFVLWNIYLLWYLESIHENGVADFDVNPVLKYLAVLALVVFYLLQTYYLAYLSHKSNAS